jgi:hypothetical protein
LGGRGGLGAIAAAIAAALVGACAHAPVALAATPPTQLTGAGCRRALLPAGRRIAITAVMRPVNGTVRMEMMFVLERERQPGRRFMAVRGRGLGVWVHPQDPTLGQRPGDLWKFDQKVTDLSAPADYRFRVRFRWLDSDRRPLASAVELGPQCREPELRPDLLVRSITVTPVAGARNEDGYAVAVRNRGLNGAGSFELALELPSLPGQVASVAYVGPHATVTETLTGPACIHGRPVTVVVDPKHAVPDYDRTNDTLTVRCP